MTDHDSDPNSSGEQGEQQDRSYRDPEYLRERYVEQRWSQQDIADECGVAQATIQYWIEKHGLERDLLYKDEKWLHKKYVENRRTRDEIADECGVSESTISRWLTIHDIERDPLYQNAEWLREQYVHCRRDQSDIAGECNVAKTTICHWLARHGITDGESLSTAECRACGDEFRYYPSVRDGKYCSNECSNEQRNNRIGIVCEGCGDTFYRRASLGVRYCSLPCWGEDYRVDTDTYYNIYWRQMRDQAIIRDEHRCVVCGIEDEEHHHRFGHGLDVHHIVPVRLFVQWDKPPEHAHSLRNLVTVCRTHHPDSPGETVDSDKQFDRSRCRPPYTDMSCE